ncbi:MAG: hypothetical protein FJ214_12665 [Ignavibacteria bacterium]|nr:hypothetical protein [Ignavibacteria bacterium]
MIKSFLRFIVISVLIITNSCNSPTEPEPLPGRRDYVWAVDTINPGQESLYLGRIWGSSQNNVWAVGPSSWTATSLWHYNGIKWRCDSIPRKINPFAIYGTSSNEVWLGNSNSTIWKYDGFQWQQYGEYKVEGYSRININNFAGLSNSNVFGVGFADSNFDAKAIIIHYNGTVWEFVSIPYVKVGLETIAIDSKTGVLVMSGTVYDSTGFIAKVYNWDGKEFRELLTGTGWSFVTKLGDEIFATLDSKVYQYSDKQLIIWKDNTGTGVNGNIICGRNRNDFFIGGVTGIVHFNGSDFSTIYKTDLTVQRGITLENTVFFIGIDYSNGKNYVIQGKLK